MYHLANRYSIHNIYSLDGLFQLTMVFIPKADNVDLPGFIFVTGFAWDLPVNLALSFVNRQKRE